jgi:hypothetical protein
MLIFILFCYGDDVGVLPIAGDTFSSTGYGIIPQLISFNKRRSSWIFRA